MNEFVWITYEHDKRNHLQMITDALNRRFQETKQRNPRGYLDQFEMQLDGHWIDVAKELKAEFSFDEKLRPVFSFVPGASLQPSNPGLKKEESHVEVK